ncbi:MAG: hypothetical protein J7647_16885 [Cyanobacteria bacterium SBLK]|nr:hypothetical protein [Cyanobacteria bacterium SBLK]
MKSVVLILLLILLFAIASPAHAAFCSQQGDRQICIVQIKRSAKNYWEYRAKVKINGEVRPTEIYNCRDRLRIEKNGSVVPFLPQGAGEYICSFFQK